jgi:hypothetical protein
VVRFVQGICISNFQVLCKIFIYECRLDHNGKIHCQKKSNISHGKTLKSLIDLFRSVIKVLEYVGEEDSDRTNRDQTNGLLVYFQSFDFVFYLHLMLTVLTTTNTLSLAL